MTAVVELAQPRKLVPRWLGHGDLTVVITPDRVYLRADQVEALAGIPPWGTGSTLLPDEWPLDVDGIDFYDIDTATTMCEQHDTALAAEFVAWVNGFLTTVDGVVLEQAHRVTPFTESLTVAQAARALDADPAITMGRDRLFELLEQQGWIERNSTHHDWTVTARAHYADWVTLRAVNVPDGHKTRRYLQVHVTPAGMTELRRILHALGRGDPPPAAITPLF